MLPFRSEEHIDTWYRRRGIATGATLTLNQQWELARIWYADRIAPDWRRRTPGGAQGSPVDAPSPGTSSGGSYVDTRAPEAIETEKACICRPFPFHRGDRFNGPLQQGSERRVFRICFGSRRRPRRRVFRMAQRPVARAVRAKRRSRGVAASSPAAGSGSCSRSGSAGDSPGARPRPPRRGRPR